MYRTNKVFGGHSQIRPWRLEDADTTSRRAAKSGMRKWSGGKFLLAVFLVCVFSIGLQPDAAIAADHKDTECREVADSLPPPSSMLLRDYETVLYRWLFCRQYASARWSHDKAVRDTGPFIDGLNYGTHPAVKIYYSPSVISWLNGGRKGSIPDGAVIVKEMYNPPAAIYDEMYRGLLRQQGGDGPTTQQAYDKLLKPLLIAWTVMIRDKNGSKDGWFWAVPKNEQTLQKMYETNLTVNYQNPGVAKFGEYVCLRCHSSAETNFTFSAADNVAGFPGEPLRFRVDESWRSESYITNLPNWKAIENARNSAGVEAQFPLEKAETPRLAQSRPSITGHQAPPPLANAIKNIRVINKAFVDAFSGTGMKTSVAAAAFPAEYADHAIPGPANPSNQTDTGQYEYITSDTCVGCHGGLGGAPSGVTMFLKTGLAYGDGYNVSEYGEWRWSPMGLAGRDPIFHAQIESEMILLRRDAEKTPSPLKGPLAATQQAVIDTCTRCHGAMGRRQLKIDAEEKRTLPQGGTLNPHFNLGYFSLVERLSKDDPIPDAPTGGVNPPISYGDGEFYQYHRYGALAREGVSCTICHRISGPTDDEVAEWTKEITAREPTWLGKDLPYGVGSMAFQFMNYSTGRYKRNDADELYGPFEKVATKPMEHALGITPKAAPPASGAIVPPGRQGPAPFTADSQMCGTCHTINLPNIGQKVAAKNVLNATSPDSPFAQYNHSIEQATFAEWQNSAFGPGLDNRPKSTFKSCQDCHMPGGFRTLDGSIKIDQLVTEIATIQDTTYPEAEFELPAEQIEVPARDNYRRHELVGLNVFMLEMARQFPDIIGVSLKDNLMTYADTGSQLAIDNMVRQARETTVAISVENISTTDNRLEATVAVENLTGHRFPSGVAFRRAFLEFQVLQDGKPIWVSGRTNAAGLILGADGQPLRTEFLNSPSDGNRFANYQPHYQTITEQDQVQIYEILELDGYPQANRTFPTTQGDALPQFTTSFVHRVHEVKDNRLLPKGWVPSKAFAAQGEIMQTFMEATDPQGVSVVGGAPEIGKQPMPNGALANGQYAPDPNYIATDIGTDRLKYIVTLPPGIDTSRLSVKATMYSQSLTPAWLFQRFTQAAQAKAQGFKTPSTDRLYHIATRLKVAGTAIEDWKLPLVSVERPVPKLDD